MGQWPDLMPKKRSLAGRWVLWPILLVAVSLLYIISTSDIGYTRLQPRLNTAVSARTTTSTPMSLSAPSSWSSFVVDTPGCRIPALDPMDAAVRKYVETPKPLHCDSKGRQLVKSNLTALFVVDAVFPDYNITNMEQLHCCYQPFYRVEGNSNNYSHGVDDKIRYDDECRQFKDEVLIEVEYVKVVCKVDGMQVYEDYHGFVPTKNKHADGDGVSVLLLGIDAVSRLNFHRQMPLTAARLREMGAIEMLGYNKVGDNTFPNMVPVLSGLSETELRNACWPTDHTVFDNCPWIWYNYSDAGYVTGFGEDAPWMGIFSYVKVGFAKQPTDYYMRPYSKLAEDQIGFKKELNAKLCVGCRMTPEVLLEYTGKFVKSMVSVPSFGLFWSASLTHDFLNYPSLGDKLYADYLSDMQRWGVLNRTVLVFMSDHGIRWGGIRETYQGRLEERLPLLYFVFPEWFRERYTAAVANVRRNEHKLTSPFDLFETLTDLLRPEEQLEQATVRRRANEWRKATPPARGISLFLPVAEDRTCEQAGIEPHWCTCQQSQAVETNSTIVNRTATFLVQHLNRLLQSYPQCAQLSLQSVQDAQLELPLKHLHAKKDQGLHDYLIVVHTAPGGGAFEATIRHRPGNDSLSVAGAVSRINAYGKQSACVDEFHLKLYCYCH